MTARDEILRRIRVALADIPDGRPEDSPVAWDYGRPTPMDDRLGRFVERCVDYRARVEQVPAAQVAATVARILGEIPVDSVVLPSGVDPTWREAVAGAGIAIHDDDPALSAVQLNEIGAVVTAARVGIAETGTIVLDHAEDQGRRALTLVPDAHVCVIAADQVVSDVPEATARLRPSIAAGRPLTWISGPSATSDIELNRVEGVHGPRRLVIVLAE